MRLKTSIQLILITIFMFLFALFLQSLKWIVLGAIIYFFYKLITKQ